MKTPCSTNGEEPKSFKGISGTLPLEILMLTSWMVGALDTICLQQTEVFSHQKLRPAIAENPSEDGLCVCRKTMFLASA
jgi:hypothetical protein